MKSQIVYPGHHQALRDFLSLVESAVKRKSYEEICSLQRLAGYIDIEHTDRLSRYMRAVAERGESHFTKEYTVIDADEFKDLRRYVYMTAYSDFSEAIIAMHDDLHVASDEHMTHLPDRYRAFNPEYFTSEQKEIWQKYTNMLDQVCTQGRTCPNRHAKDIKRELRGFEVHLETIFGAHIPVLVAVYMKDGHESYGVRASLYEGVVSIETQAPFYRELDKYIIKRAVSISQDTFTHEIFPKFLDGFECSSVTRSELLPFEAIP